MREPDGRERTILVALAATGSRRPEVEEHLDELERLLDTAGGVVVERMVQERPRPDPATLVGRGFARRLAERCRELGAAAVVFDDDLSPSQVRNLERLLPDGVKVLDRSGVILDIFAARARTREAMTQVELAQLTYLLPRLTRRWRHLSRQAGGIGTRGVGETQLEIDRRLIQRRIAQLRRQLAGIERSRRLRRQRRRDVPRVALVGYTNAGKSSLMRALTRAEVVVEDRLFATLDPRSRRLDLGDGLAAVLTDTVGFIRKLPHELVAPFRSTLEEAAEADLVLHVVDASHPAWEAHLEVGRKVLSDLGVDTERVLEVANKMDLVPGPAARRVAAGRAAVSAVTGAGLDALRETVRVRLLAGGGMQLLRIPLGDRDAVALALGSRDLVARRFDDREVTVAIRTDEAGLERLGLGRYRIGAGAWARRSA